MNTTTSTFPDNGSPLATVSTRKSVQDVAADFPQDWPLLPLGSFYLFSNGANSDKGAYGSGVPFINVLEVLNHTHINARHIPGRVRLPTHIVDSFSVRRGDILFNRTSETQEEVGLASTYADDATVIFGGFVIRARPIDNTFDPTYAGYGFRAPAVRRQIIAKGQGAIRANIGQTGLKSVLVPIPPMPEQRAIAAALSDVDELIGALDKLIAKKRAIKLATTQQLLTGKTRLPGFSEEWMPQRLGDGICLSSGHHVLAQYCNTTGEGVPYLTGPADFPNGEIILTKYTTKPGTMCDLGNILVTVKGSGAGTIVIADSRYCISRQLMAISVREWNSRFIYYSLLQNGAKLLAASTGLIPGLSRSDILGQELPMPVDRDEQTTIASVLTDMDAEIAALEERRDKTKSIKQGMMQSLLTGRIRLVEPSVDKTEGQ